MPDQPLTRSDRNADRRRALILAARQQAEQVPPSDGSPDPVGAAAELESRRVALAADDIPGFRLIREVHRGGQGVVYQARAEAGGRDVAIKVLRGRRLSDPQARARFEREIHILRRLAHPGIVAVRHSGTAGEHAYYVTEYIEGRRLDEWIVERRLDVPQPRASDTPGAADRAAERRHIQAALRLFVEICDAVNAAHRAGVVHRDLKPGNILIDADERPHILDFGLARASEQDSEAAGLTGSGQFLGSWPWAAPEQVEGHTGQADVRADVYALGVILFQMLTGRLPYDVFADDEPQDVLDAQPIPPSDLRSNLDEELDAIVLACRRSGSGWRRWACSWRAI